MSLTSEKMKNLWADPEYQERFRKALAAAREASMNLGPRTRAERSYRVSRAASLKRSETSERS